MTYKIKSPYYADYSVDVHGPYVIAFGVANAIHKTEKIDVDIIDESGDVVHSFHKN